MISGLNRVGRLKNPEGIQPQQEMHHGRIACHSQDVALPRVHAGLFRKLLYQYPKAPRRSFLKLAPLLRLILGIEDTGQNIVPVGDLRVKHTLRRQGISSVQIH